MHFDILIKNAKVIDGSENPWMPREIGIKEGKIIKILPKLKSETADKVINAGGLITCPGFINMHSHSDMLLPFYNRMDTAIRQGITTEVVGMCGESLAPIPSEKVDVFKKLFAPPMGGELKITWDTFKSYLNEVSKMHVPCNLAFCVGFSTIRVAGGPGFENRSPTEKEMQTMKSLVAEAMEAGAFGMSTGLIYSPQVFAKTEEIIELAKVVAQYNGLYFSHIRGEGNTLIEAVKEFIEIVEKSGVAGGQIAHHKVADKRLWGMSKETLRLIEEANERGLSITYDQYPYNRGQSGLVSTLPPWTREGGPDKILERLKDPEIREKIKTDIFADQNKWESWIKAVGFEHVYISFLKNKNWKDVEGKNISEITKIKGKIDEWETYFKLLIDEKTDIPITIESIHEEDIRRIMKGRYHMVGTDANAFKHLPGFKIFHPRTYGTYPKILGKYVRDEGLLTMEEAIRKMTSFPAQRLGLRDRGLIREGYWADIVIFDPMTVRDNATFEDPHQFPSGIIDVIVNGVLVVENEKQKRKYPGKILKRTL